MPVRLGVTDIAVVLPGGDFVDERLFVGNAAVEALGGRNRRPTLCRPPHDVGVTEGMQEPAEDIVGQAMGDFVSAISCISLS